MTTKRVRSPNYPAISLTDAIHRAEQIFNKEHTHPADSDTLAQALGYSGTNGASDVVLSALKKYGLLEDTGNREYKLSPNAIDIVLHERGTPERRKAITEAAFTPQLFSELYDDFGIKPPPSENNLRVRLLKRGFNVRAVSEVIRAYLDTIDLLMQEAPDFVGGTTGEVRENKAQNEMRSEQVPPRHDQGVQSPAHPVVGQSAPPPITDEAVLVFRISRDSEARVTFSGQVTQEAIEKLRLLLEMSKDTFPTQQDLEQQSQVRSAIWRNKDHDQPVKVLGDFGQGPDGRSYVRIDGSDAGVPSDELEFID